eukprot:3228983-Pyramimonas_sp.AAC.1
MEEVISGNGWQRQSRGSSAGMLHALLEGYQLLASNPNYRGGVKQGNVGVYSFPHENDDPSIRTKYAMAEETFVDGYWNTVEVVFG